MTLGRQLFLGLSALFLGVLSGLLWMSVQGTRDYLEEQLASHAQDAATALSLPLAQVMTLNDPLLVQLHVDGVFDRGYFQRIVVIDPVGEVLVSKQLASSIEGVPDWFIRQFPLNPPGGEAFVTSGWRQLGKVVVQSQPHHAYQYLWGNAREVAVWVGLVYAVALLLTHFLLRLILNPLYAIERTAQAVQQRRFEQIADQPKARELARVVRAMNDMSRRIAEILDAEVRKAEGYRRQVMLDELTGLENRKSFDMRLGPMLEGKEAITNGLLIGIEVNGLKGFNTGSSYQRGNALLLAVAQTAREVFGDATSSTGVSSGGCVRMGARLGGVSFGWILDGGAAADLRSHCVLLMRALDARFLELDPELQASFSMGVVRFSEGQSKGALLARLDVAIEVARQSGRNQLHTADEDGVGSKDALGSQGWKELIETALAEKRWGLLGQGVRRFADGALLHTEVMGRLLGRDGELVPAASFIPMAVRHRLMPEVDRAIISMARQRAMALGMTAPGILAVNVSMQSLESGDFLAWLQGELQSMGKSASRLAFEVSAYGCGQNFHVARQFADMVRRFGGQFGIDRVGLDPASTQLLKDLPPDYVKLDSVQMLQSDQSEVAQDWVGSLVVLARSLNVTVVAQGVETAEQADQVAATHDAGQGYYFSTPSRW
jgi:EAL domain-containing protein (putative c-di-GMP-specific phosphodiesterase class I)/GGDEF domain-containing protein